MSDEIFWADARTEAQFLAADLFTEQETDPMNAYLMDAVNEANAIVSQLGTACESLSEAIAREGVVSGYKRETESLYSDAEAEFTFEAMMSIEGKNAETRKAGLDAALVRARTAGPLAEAWRMKLAQADAYAQAKVQREIAETRFAAVRVAADLKAAIVKALSA